MTSGSARDQAQCISVVLIEDNRLVRKGIVDLIRKQPDFTVLAAPATVGRALKRVRETRPRVVLLDCGLVGHDSVQLTATIHQAVPEARIVAMGLLPFQQDVADFVNAGASGFVMKNAPVGDVLTTLRSVAQGVEVVPPGLTLGLSSRSALEATPDARLPLLEAVRLTKRELQVLGLAGDGQSNQEIASHLHIPLQAVKSHLQNLLEKLALRTRLESDAPVPPSMPRPSVALPN